MKNIGKLFSASLSASPFVPISFMAWRSLLWRLLLFYPSLISLLYHTCLSEIFNSDELPILFKLVAAVLGLYFRFCDLSPCTIDLDDQTTMHFWTTNQRRPDKPDLVMIHGFSGSPIWQLLGQVGHLSRAFNVYLPDLLFFGKSHTKWPECSEIFQAKCVAEGMRRLGVNRYSLYGISYGGFVAYRLAEMCPEEVAKVVIVNSPIIWTDDQKREFLIRNGRTMQEILLPETPSDLRHLITRSTYKSHYSKWVPDFLLSRFIQVLLQYREEKIGLLESWLNKTACYSNVPIITQDTLIIWSDKDNLFPLYLGYQLYRHMEGKAKLEILKDTGHAANLDSADAVNVLIKSFLLNSS